MCRLWNIALESVTDGQTDIRTDVQTDGQTDGRTMDKVIPMSRYASQATQKLSISEYAESLRYKCMYKANVNTKSDTNLMRHFHCQFTYHFYIYHNLRWRSSNSCKSLSYSNAKNKQRAKWTNSANIIIMWWTIGSKSPTSYASNHFQRPTV